MTQVVDTNADRVELRAVNKFAERRTELARAALHTLGELGYARTSLREIAQNSEFSHGVLHYYFTDKVDLITHCVKLYKAECVVRYDEIVAAAETAEALRTGFAAGMVATMEQDAPMHRLWYDLRNQALFEEVFGPDVGEMDQSLQQMIWRVVSRYAELRETPLTVDPPFAYGLFDGLFRHALGNHLHGGADAGDRLRAQVCEALDRIF
ncbi:MAG: TetR/AcrR family transcriptional regulator [Jatrophihabitans sp.]